ncbi:Hha/YmoA family nucleoid-associated regulatory protein [Enterobacter sp. Ag1]|uniref:Hha/YmoA family nucleoid-associated regulatory protein n=1 Tax=Enterobacteriaceae TaxID=543 RepID=UPI0012F4D6F7
MFICSASYGIKSHRRKPSTKNHDLSEAKLAIFWEATDHHLAELITGTLYDNASAEI